MKYKEFLNMKNGYTLEILPEHAGDDKESGLIEVPEGAEFLTECFDDGELFRLWWKEEYKICIGYDEDWFKVHFDVDDYLEEQSGSKIVWQRPTQPEELPFIGDDKKHSHYFIDVSDVDEIDFYQIALRYKVTDPCVQHILKKCLAVGGRGHKDFLTDLRDIADTAKRALEINNAD